MSFLNQADQSQHSRPAHGSPSPFSPGLMCLKKNTDLAPIHFSSSSQHEQHSRKKKFISLVPFQAEFPFQKPVRFRQNDDVKSTNTTHSSSGGLVHIPRPLLISGSTARPHAARLNTRRSSFKCLARSCDSLPNPVRSSRHKPRIPQ